MDEGTVLYRIDTAVELNVNNNNQVSANQILGKTITNTAVADEAEKKADGLNAIDDEGQIVYPGKTKLAAILTALYLAAVLVALDRTIIAPAIPTITNEFDSLVDVGWYASAYLLPGCAFQLFFARVYTFYNTKWVFLTAIGLFELGSAISGAAPNSAAFIAGRAVAGFGSAGLFNGVIVLMIPVLPLKERPKYQGIFGAIFGLFAVAGPVMGGAFTKHVSWRWCFYINLPVGGLAILLILFLLKTPNPTSGNTSLRRQIEQLDPLGSVCFLPGISCLLLALQWGGSTYAWSSSRIVALLVIAGVLLIAFVCVQIWKQEDATIPPRIISQRSIYAGVAFSIFVGSTMLCLVYYLPIWFQAVKGASAQKSGIMALPLALGLIFGSLGGGVFVSKVGYYAPMMLASSVFLPIGCGLITTFKVDSSDGAWIGYQIIAGLGVGLGMQQANLAAQTTLPKKDVPTGTALMFFSQALGASIFILLTENVFAHRLVADLAAVRGLDPESVLLSGATEFRHFVPASLLPAVLVAYNKALTTAYLIPVATACMSIVGAMAMEWNSVKGRKRGQIGKDED